MNDRIFYHYVFNTYKGKSTLKNYEHRKYLRNIFKEVATTKGFKIIIVRILEDHVHLLLEQGINDSTNYVMRMFKGIASRRFFKEYPTNRFVHRKLWARSYYAEQISKDNLGEKTKYIENQINKQGIDKRYYKGVREPRGSLSGSRR